MSGGDDEIDFWPPLTTSYAADVEMRSADRRQLIESTGIDLRRPPPPPAPEHAAAVERIREKRSDETFQLRTLVDEYLDRRGEVSAPEVRDSFFGRFRSASPPDKVETRRIMQRIRHLLVGLADVGELRLKEIRMVDAPGSNGMVPCNYYERVRAPERGEDE